MGFAAVAGLVLSGVGVANQVSSQRKASKADKEQARLNEEAKRVQNAQYDIEDSVSRRKAAKIARINMARVENAGTQGGAKGSSGLLGFDSAIISNLGATVAEQSQQIKTNKRLTDLNNLAARAADKAQSALNRGQAIQAGLGLVGQGIQIGADEGLWS